MSDEWFFVLVFVDDLHMAAGGRERWMSLWKFIASLEMVGALFSYRKFREGFTLDCIGYWLDYGKFQLGISERCTAWLVDFIDRLELDQWLIMTRRFQEFHGRLGFSAQVLPWVRPLLAPGYAWLAAVGKAATVKEFASSWASTSAELLASLVALKVFELATFSSSHQSATHLLKCGGGTDNKAASQLVRKRLSTKIPLMVVLMDYLGFCEEQGLHCQLDWRPRDTHVEADQLTNGIFDSFDLSRRLEVTWEKLEFPMIDRLMKFAESFSKRKVLDAPRNDGEGREKFVKPSWG
eukprot:s1226_g22.t1